MLSGIHWWPWLAQTRQKEPRSASVPRAVWFRKPACEQMGAGWWLSVMAQSSPSVDWICLLLQHEPRLPSVELSLWQQTAYFFIFDFWPHRVALWDLGSSTKDRNHTSLKWKHQVLKLVDHFHLEVSKLHVKSLYTWRWFMLMYDGNHQNIVISL